MFRSKSVNKIIQGVGGRLEISSFSCEGKHPLILPSKSHLTRLVIENELLRLLHASVRFVHATIREEHWTINGRDMISVLIHRCLKCYRFKAKQVQQLTGQLPTPRVTKLSRPFLNCGTDYVGPLLIYHGG